ncbi:MULTISPECIES: co-chaperone HscB [Idiomarinaceae]|uniref:Co-chaperone protein HscB homolog n=2 Tax=Pseudidiomarina TaxID=2800384 RepID=A0A368UMB1_9GAMM|nr:MULTISPECIES: co-chaperone HscB [Idiomarinaceae]MRJ42587.1 co-chaperone HscB [Idiomarina sp. FeN1]NCU58200.1 co-chaperone HscB [Idiomarina sp. FenA--70]NCU60898.1 co-chaperone HscB [Idiomarina sp. FenBw--71]PWW10330.1 molecular chaperone HscB [Pseudidiomarina maritima]RBP87965.1 molecular chaperone HscB [Pseudidiomarina tainanensis]
MNHFELFDLPAAFNLDAADLQQRYRKLQQTLHPDRFANGSQRDKLLAVQRTAQLNDAYQTLRNPLLRAEYILQLRGLDLAHEQTTLQDPEFLMAQMEWRERIAELNDWEEIDAALRDLAVESRDLQSELEQQINAEQNEAAANSIRKLKFMLKLEHELEEKSE